MFTIVLTKKDGQLAKTVKTVVNLIHVELDCAQSMQTFTKTSSLNQSDLGFEYRFLD